jgi:molybdopterin converting factor small subunit
MMPLWIRQPTFVLDNPKIFVSFINVFVKVVTPVRSGVQFLLNRLKRLDSGCSLSRNGCRDGMTEKGDFDFLRFHQIWNHTTLSKSRNAQMSLKVLLSSTLRDYVPDYDPIKGLDLTIDREISVEELCRQIGVSLDRIKMVMVNGQRRPFDHFLKGDERVALFPPVGGG